MESPPLRFSLPALPGALPCPDGPHRAFFLSLAVSGIDGRNRIRAAELHGVDPESLAWVITRTAPYLHVREPQDEWKDVDNREAVWLALETLERPGRVLPFLQKAEKIRALWTRTKDPVLHRDLLESGRAGEDAAQSTATQP